MNIRLILNAWLHFLRLIVKNQLFSSHKIFFF
uniref:Uncharacterized protein n=1 Tax=Arundo donax TaxID=35708 RepID=A0A0A9BUI5_ARUDO